MKEVPVSSIPEEILVAPDSFKGTFSAHEVAAAIGRGLERGGRPVSLCPVADGGEGTLAVLATALGLSEVEREVGDPLGRPVRARYGLGEETALVEVAAASGLYLVAAEERDPFAASTRGTGELIADAVAHGARTVYVTLGGSATTDGGAGVLEVLGDLAGVRIIALCDTQVPFERAAEVFGPQKGADPAAVGRLTDRLHEQAIALPRDPRGVPHSGGAGGLAGALWAAYGAELRSGASFVLDTLDFDARMRAARAVVVGEGRIDRQTLSGKIAGEIATRCRQAGVPCHAIVGTNDLDRFDQRILDLQVILEAGTLAELEAAGEALAARL